MSILTLTFTVREPVSINEAYVFRRFGKGRDRACSEKAREFKERVKIAALIARQQSAWPVDLWHVGLVEVSLQMYDVRMDADACRKLARDAMEGALYVNDRIVQDGRSPLPINDGNGRRVEITVELLALRSDVEAKAARQKWEAARAKRLAKKRSAA